MTSVIHAEELTKTYRDQGVPVEAVRGVDMSIEEGEFTAIVGPSGSGKTTLLNMIGGLDAPTGGHLRIADHDLVTMASKDLIEFRLHNIGFVFQAFNLIPVLTAQENVEFTMLLQKRPAEERRARSRELLEAVGLLAESDRRPFELSGGQQQRVAVARALATKPRFVLADEPTANLDSSSAENLLDIMESLNAQEAVTFVFSTHDPRVMHRARRVITLTDGRISRDAGDAEGIT